MTPILMYHSISVNAPHPFRQFAVAPDRFDEQMRSLADEGYTALTVTEYVRVRHSEAYRRSSKRVVLTFDDGFADFHEHALPILAKFGFTATLYVVSGHVGGHSRWLEKANSKHLKLVNWSQLSEIAAQGIEIGAHTVTHPALDMLPLEHAKQQIVRSKRELEDRLGQQIDSFAYPYGFYSKAVRDLVVAAGYRSACAVRYATSHAHDDGFALSRHIIRHDMTLSQLGHLLAGRVDARMRYDRMRSKTWACLRHAIFAQRTLAGLSDER